MIASACPGWVCYAEKTENALRDVNLLAKAKSPQAIAGTFAKREGLFSEDEAGGGVSRVGDAVF